MFFILYTFLFLRHTLGVGLGGRVGWANNVLALAYLVDGTSQKFLENSCYTMLLSLVLLIQLSATLRYHFVDATSQEHFWTSCYAMLLKYDQHAFICLCLAVAPKVPTNTVETFG